VERKVVRRGTRHEAGFVHSPGDERGVLERAHADRRVDSRLDQVDATVLQDRDHLEVGVLRGEPRQGGHDELASDRDRQIDPEEAVGQGPAGGEHRLRFLDVRQHPPDVIEVRRTVVSER
jgi:hypothetical protein